MLKIGHNKLLLFHADDSERRARSFKTLRGMEVALKKGAQISLSSHGPSYMISEHQRKASERPIKQDPFVHPL